jgi:hypothetical protein
MEPGNETDRTDSTVRGSRAGSRTARGPMEQPAAIRFETDRGIFARNLREHGLRKIPAPGDTGNPDADRIIDRLLSDGEKNARVYLQELVTALDGAFVSSWQTTAAWQAQLDAAKQYLHENPTDDFEG